jgi:deoxyribodipyrimidine photo-lyase
MNENRVRKLNAKDATSGPVVYWMSRDQRAEDNWALLFAQETALSAKVPLLVVFNLVPNFLGGISRQHEFKLRGLEEVASSLEKKHIPFFIVTDRTGESSAKTINDFVTAQGAGAVVTDFSPLRLPRRWVKELRKLLSVPLYEVDTHNIVPCWIASPKLEFGAYTLRPKLHKLLPEFLEEFPALKPHPHRFDGAIPEIDWGALSLLAGPKNEECPLTFIPGSLAARKRLKYFINEVLPEYALLRNDPNSAHQSALSPYLHYGQIASGRVALETLKAIGMPIEEVIDKAKNKAKVDKDEVLLLEDHAGAFLEELIVRRELSDNFCFYQADYDSPLGFPDWAKKSHERHRSDKREYLYTRSQFERAETHDELWNACQKELLKTGKMHGYMRMYWAKKILEWTLSVEQAMEIAIYLNDTYELDGRDPNGYAGIAWSLGGVHDRAWFDRPVYGQVRYMNRNGCATKFSVDTYIRTWA